MGHHLDSKTIQIHCWQDHRFEYGLLYARMCPINDGLAVSRRWQRDQTVDLHTQKRHAATHIFESPAGLTPIQPLTNFAGDAKATGWWGGGDQRTDELDV